MPPQGGFSDQRKPATPVVAVIRNAMTPFASAPSIIKEFSIRWLFLMWLKSGNSEHPALTSVF